MFDVVIFTFFLCGDSTDFYSFVLSRSAEETYKMKRVVFCFGASTINIRSLGPLILGCTELEAPCSLPEHACMVQFVDISRQLLMHSLHV